MCTPLTELTVGTRSPLDRNGSPLATVDSRLFFLGRKRMCYVRSIVNLTIVRPSNEKLAKSKAELVRERSLPSG